MTDLTEPPDLFSAAMDSLPRHDKTNIDPIVRGKERYGTRWSVGRNRHNDLCFNEAIGRRGEMA